MFNNSFLFDEIRLGNSFQNPVDMYIQTKNLREGRVPSYFYLLSICITLSLIQPSTQELKLLLLSSDGMHCSLSAVKFKSSIFLYMISLEYYISLIRGMSVCEQVKFGFWKEANSHVSCLCLLSARITLLLVMVEWFSSECQKPKQLQGL